MPRFLHDLVSANPRVSPDHPALRAGRAERSYAQLSADVQAIARALLGCGLSRFGRIAVFLDKRIETVAAFLGASAAGGIFVPCNPVLKPPQIAHILTDSGAEVLISSKARIEALGETLSQADVRTVVSVDALPQSGSPGIRMLDWESFLSVGQDAASPAGPTTDTDPAAIFYTSGSTGRPKGVTLSHRNLLVGGDSVAEYLENGPDDRILALLPLSFDAGFSQLTTGFSAGATVVLHNYLLSREVPKLCAKEGITGLTCVPPLWMQLLSADWPDEARQRLRYFANTGGRMPRDVLEKLRSLFPRGKPYLMYGLTEAFRSTYLDPLEVDRRPDSIGKAIPNAEILVVKADGTLAGRGEEGELVHRGPLVALGYWNDPERTAVRYKPVPAKLKELPIAELAVWSGDLVRADEEGFLYFVGRADDMIKTSGYRVSPTEVEEVVFSSGLVREAAAFGVPHETLGQEIVVAAVPAEGYEEQQLFTHCAAALPRFMVPARIVLRHDLPRSPNGKIDRKALLTDLQDEGREMTA